MDNSCKFRYWDNRFKRWVVGKTVYLSNDGMAFLDVDPHGVDISGQVRIYPVDSLELVWSTGLCDSEGVDVFEGDVVEWEDGTGVVFYDNEDARFLHTWKEKIDGCSRPSKAFWSDIKIIGNRFENPELLEE